LAQLVVLVPELELELVPELELELVPELELELALARLEFLLQDLE
jgi:hypothetical protein